MKTNWSNVKSKFTETGYYFGMDHVFSCLRSDGCQEFGSVVLSFPCDGRGHQLFVYKLTELIPGGFTVNGIRKYCFPITGVPRTYRQVANTQTLNY